MQYFQVFFARFSHFIHCNDNINKNGYVETVVENIFVEFSEIEDCTANTRYQKLRNFLFLFIQFDEMENEAKTI